MTFQSILFEVVDEETIKESPEMPACFGDLNLDQVINAITANRQEYHLKPFFYHALRDADTIQYRHAILQDLEQENLMDAFQLFSNKMILMRRYLRLVEKLDFKNHKEGWFLEAVEVYCEGVQSLQEGLSAADLKSSGLQALRAFVSDYVHSRAFLNLLAETNELKKALSTVKYCVIIKDLNVKVRKYEAETDYSVEVEETFAKFKQGAVKDYRVKLVEGGGMTHVEAQILDCVARLYPEIFTSLDNFCLQHGQFVDETLRVLDREIQFYLAYLEYIAKLKGAGLRFCYPQVTSRDKEIYDEEGFDVALAYKLVAEKSAIVCNDFYLQGEERILIVSGPNQGGKTTFARTFGQLHYLASLGLPVPGKKARLYLFDQIFTHFEREENIKNLRGKLLDDLVRINEILRRATPESIIIMNEIFTSTSVKDAVFLSKKIMERIIRLDLLCVCVTFLDELASLNENTVSMVSTVVPENPALRTFKILRKPADGLAYALSIAEKYQLTYERLIERIQP